MSHKNHIYSSDIINNVFYSQLKDLDTCSDRIILCVKDIVSVIFGIESRDVHNVKFLKNGMTNRSFLFNVKNNKYIIRIPDKNTNTLINRNEEYDVYKCIEGLNISEEILYIDPKSGCKISKFIEKARTCNPKNIVDVEKCIKLMRKIHGLNLIVNHEFDIFSKIEFYESLWNGQDSIYYDYVIVKKNIWKLKKYIDSCIIKKTLTHIDAVCDNFLFIENNGKCENIRLIDWEYAGMQDCHVDIAMFAVYAMYERSEIDRLIDMYFYGQCDYFIRIKIYCYIACCGLLWSNWCEYKSRVGVEFGEYAQRQYEYAKEYFNIVHSMIYLS